MTGFPVTSLNLLASLQSVDISKREVSIARFCTMYYPPIYGLARGLGLSALQAENRAQEFFVHLMQQKLLEKYAPVEGQRFSHWLMDCFQEFAQTRVNLHEETAAPTAHQVNLDTEVVEARYSVLHGAHLEPGPAFDLTLAQEIWRTARLYLLRKHQNAANGSLVEELLPFLLHETWPEPPAPSLEELAARHKQTPNALRNFMNRTLKRRARSAFDEVAVRDSPGITEQDLDHLWLLLCRYGESL